jgi:hypothetical protein
MGNSADTESLILKCMTRSPNREPLTARTVAACLDSPYSVYCEKFVDKKEKDEISEYDQLLFQKGNDHEKNVVREKYPFLCVIMTRYYHSSLVIFPIVLCV